MWRKLPLSYWPLLLLSLAHNRWEKVPAALSEFKIPGIESGLTCSQPPRETISVPRPVLERAKLKAQLANLLHSSLLDDASGIVNIKREKEIRKLANRLQRTP